MATADLTSSVELLRMSSAAWLSQALGVAAELGIADLLADGPRSVDELARATSSHAPSLYRLLRGRQRRRLP
jgi:C-methyltransferase